MNIQQLFKLGMKRDIPELLDIPPGIVLNVGAGTSTIEGARNLDYPEWEAETYKLPYRDGSVAGIHAYHFLEHVQKPAKMLAEFAHTLQPGGVLNICVPHRLGDMAYQDPDHKHFFVLDSWKTMLDQSYYYKGKISPRLRLHANFIIGIAERNLCILTQFQKEST